MTSDDARIGEIFLDRLQVIRRIGGGGMGAVYEVEHLRTGHRRALKIVRPEYSAQPRYMQRLLREARVAATLKTPHVADTLDAGVLEDGSAYVLMELLEGRPLIALLEERRRLDPEEVVWLATEICRGLEVAHAAGIVHRDLKPENIFLVPSGDQGAVVKLLDFGISQFPASLADAPTRLTREGTILGTPFYMSPEQAAGRKMDARTDLYALGVVMYEALSGSLPFDSPTIGELFMRIAAGEYRPLTEQAPEVDPNLAAVVARAMHRDPSARYASAEKLARALEPFSGMGPAAPGRVTLRLNALAKPKEPRVETLDYAASPAERETMAASDPPLAEAALTPAAGVAARNTPLAPRPPSGPPEAAPAASMDGPAFATTPPAGTPLRSSHPPPASLHASIAPAPPPRRPPWVLVAAFAVAIVVAALGYRFAGDGTSPAGAEGLPERTEVDAAAPEEPPPSIPDAGQPPARAETAPDAGVAEPAVAPENQVTGPSAPTMRADGDRRPPIHHPDHRPSQAAGLDQNPY